MNESQIEYLLDDWLAEWELAREEGREVSVDQICAAHPELTSQFLGQIRRLRSTTWMLVDQASNVGLSKGPSQQNQYSATDSSEVTAIEFISTVAESGLLTEQQLAALKRFSEDELTTSQALAARLVENGSLTKYQADVILHRRSDPLLLDRYIILDVIGAGGMGMVFKALHRSMERLVAIKVLPSLAFNSPDKILRFQREVKSVARISHPNVVVAFDAHESNGTHFLVMEYVDGEDLRSVVQLNGCLDVDDAISIIDQVAAGLGASHEMGLVHRDVKPTNVMLTTNGTAKLLDLGLARMMLPESSPSDSELTVDGLGMGTASYMSPEQALDARIADARSDIYSLGCTLYYLLTGSVPFVCKTTVQTIIAHRELPAPSLRETRPDVTPALESVYQRMVAKSPDARFQNVNEFRAALASAQSSTGITTHLDTHAVAQIPGPTQKASSRHTRLLASLAIGIVVLVGLGWGLSTLWQADSIRSSDLVKRVIRSGGMVTIEDELGTYEIESDSDIPESDFRIVGIDLVADSDEFSIEPALAVPEIESISLTDVSRIEFQRIATLQSLKELAFYHCEVNDSDLTNLTSMKHLESLTLFDCGITDQGMAHLEKLQQLKFLDIGRTEVTAKGLKHLSSLSELKWLDLTDLDVQASDLQVLPTRIENLVLSSCDVGDEVVSVLHRFEDLEMLDLQGTSISVKGIESLASMLKLSEIDLSDTDIKAEGIRALGRLPALKTLTMMGTDLTDEEYEALSELENVEALDLSNSNVNDDDLKIIARMKGLSVIYLDGTPTTEAGIEIFQRSGVAPVSAR